MGLYLDRHTCSVADDNPSNFIILVDDVQVPSAATGSTRISNRFCHRFRFNLVNHKAFSYEPFSDSWRELNPYVSNPEDDDFTFDVTIAEIAFFIATGNKFFGTDVSRFNDDFYIILGGL